jgi:hypothetical protein
MKLLLGLLLLIACFLFAYLVGIAADSTLQHFLQ